MATIIEPLSFEHEEILDIPVAGSGVQCSVVSGYANFSDSVTVGDGPYPEILTGDVENDDDKLWIKYTVHMVVGPKWRDVRDVSPIVAVAGFSFLDSDSADHSGTQLDECTWDTVGLSEGETDFERIRLKVELQLCGGERYGITKLAYHLVAVGRRAS